MSHGTPRPIAGPTLDDLSLDSWVDQALVDVQSDVDRYFTQQLAAASVYGDYRRLWQSIGEASRGGKGMRPRFVLTAYWGFGGHKADRDAAVAVGVAYELLHTAFLLHDDVIDGDLMRRGRPNVFGTFFAEAQERGASAERARRWGETAGILAGDLLLHAASDTIARIDVDIRARNRLLDILEQSVFVSAAGELADAAVGGLGDEEPRLDDVLAMSEWKTSAYSVSGPLMSGAVLAGADEGALAVLAEFGRLVGLAFQLGDDLLGVFGSEDVTGKSVVSDLREGKETSLIAYARGTSRWPEIAPLLGNDDLGVPEARRIAEMLEGCGARRFVETLLAEQVDQAIELVGCPSIPPTLADSLTEMARSCTSRAA